MLDPRAGDLVDAVARLCVLRTEDYTLVNTVYKRERNALSQQLACNTDSAAPVSGTESSVTPIAYVSYLTEEIQKREFERCEAERRWCESLREWAHVFLAQLPSPLLDSAVTAEPSSVPAGKTPNSPPSIGAFWKTSPNEKDEVSSFQQVYATVIRHAYELKSADLANAPFAQLHGSACLFDSVQANSEKSHLTSCEASDGEGVAHASSLTGLRRVHSLFFPASSADAPPFAPSSSPTAVLDVVYPLSGDEALPELSRSRLALSRHVWLVLIFLWCHAVSASCTATPPRAPADNRAHEEWLVDTVLHDPASKFLRSQAQLLEALLAKVRKACEGN
ncbi:hypothetical protein ABL78_7322 [Leptomonas seymouri]|uniref:Uncharacterized protein n=1 Tax=Leptomonas seymouri TaxID=5684 RepID=A0A0N1P9K1_LEPSE|nr:hypothetical protein ABL78_7322 [Leptomonas seymouri]|eukprot:KPI83633.1 hypothetical protein ABL78_7322 [Leptomonas seymouri]